jgi:UDP-glucose 4-epimerase
MKYLVTGGAGFIGSNIVDSLIKLGHEVVVIDNESSESHDYFFWNKNAKNYKLDICDYENTRSLYDGVDYVFHVAAEARIQRTIKNPIRSVKTNVVGTITVLQCSKEANVKRVVYSSTSSAYGKNEIPNEETQLDDCLNPYSISKVAGEKLCSMYTNIFGLDTIIFRYFNVYGDKHPTKGIYAPVIGLFDVQKLNGEKLTIVGDGEQRRDFTNVKDVVDINILATTKDIDRKYFGNVFNVGTGTNYSVNQIASFISDNTINIPERLGEARETLANIKKVKEVFDWEPSITLDQWFKERNV